jgi:hypothetical protein
MNTNDTPRYALTRTTWQLHTIADASKMIPNLMDGKQEGWRGRYRTLCGRSLRAAATYQEPGPFARCPHCVEAEETQENEGAPRMDTKIAYTWQSTSRPQERYIVVPGTRTLDWELGTEADDALFDYHGALIGSAQERALAKYRADGYDVIELTGTAWPAGYRVISWSGRNGYQAIGEERA